MRATKTPEAAERRSEDEGRRAGWGRKLFGALLARADVRLDGDRPWDPQLKRPRAITRAITRGTLGAGESYTDGDWECAAIDELVCRLLRAGVDNDRAFGPVAAPAALLSHLGNRQTRRRARKNATAHYDRGNELYRAMLGPTMTYSCGYWRDAASLDEAQNAKHDLACRKLQLEPGQRVLDIGCGWGAFAKFAAENYGVEVVGCTVSPAQGALARRYCAGLPVEIVLEDYRALSGRFDRVVSIGMFEHVGPANYRTFFKTVKRVLAPHGLFLLHTIGSLRSVRTIDPWIDRYIFPNAVLPSASQISSACEDLFVVEDWHNFGADYDRTLIAWHENFEAAWSELRDRYDERFRRMWRYYLLSCAGTFRARRNQLWQIVLSPRGVPDGYRRVGV